MANQRVEIELPPIDASPDGLRALAMAVGAPHVHLPAEASRHSQCLDFHALAEWSAQRSEAGDILGRSLEHDALHSVRRGLRYSSDLRLDPEIATLIPIRHPE